MKLGVVSLGCDKATVDSERLVGQLVGHGAVLTPELADSDVILVNTCGFIDAAKRESIDAMLDACSYKAGGTVKAVVAVGCLIERYKKELEEEIPEVDFFFGFSDLHKLVPALAERGLIEDPLSGHPGIRQPVSGNASHVRYLKISEGCDHTCAFCAIPLMRGKHRSEPLERLVREAQQLEAQGAREINLVAQDLGHYGRDLGLAGPKLPDLLEALLRQTSVPWYRLMYVYSAGLSEGLVELIARQPRIVPYLDLPIQHASDAVLARMRRPERQASLRAKLAWLRQSIPDLAIRTTCLVGFPGETDADFRELLAFLEEAQFDRLGAFAYSPQDGTRAAVLEDDVPDEIKRDRLEELLEVQRAISGERLARFVGRETEVLVDEMSSPPVHLSPRERGNDARSSYPFSGTERGTGGEDTYIGRVKWQADDVDGLTYVEAMAASRCPMPGVEPGAMIPVRIVGSEDYDFRAVALT